MRAPLVAIAAALAIPASAAAQLGLPLPTTDPTQTITDTTGQVTDTVTGTLSDPGGTIDTVTGTVGGVIDTVSSTTGGATDPITDPVTGTIGSITDPISDTIDQVLGGSLPSLPTGTIDQLLGSAGLPGVTAGGSPGVKTLPDGSVVVDNRPPVTTVKVLNRNRQVGRNGKLALRIGSDEPSVVALTMSVRPGRAWHLHGKRHSRKAIKVPRVVLAYRKAGALKVTIQFSSRAQKRLRHSFNSTMRITLVAVDVARNQVTRKLNRVVKH